MASTSCGGRHPRGPCRMVCLILLGGNQILLPWRHPDLKGQNSTRGCAPRANRRGCVMEGTSTQERVILSARIEFFPDESVDFTYQNPETSA
jgi:hypothetical protein